MRRGFSLLEVILALAILVGAIVVMGEVSRLSLRNAQYARDVAFATMLCESKLSEVLGGVTQPTAGQGNFDASIGDGRAWSYSIESDAGPELGLLIVRVTVQLAQSSDPNSASVTLTRWMPDPTYDFSGGTSEQSSGSSGQNANGS